MSLEPPFEQNTALSMQDIFNKCFREDELYLRVNTDVQVRNIILEAPLIRSVDLVSTPHLCPQQIKGARFFANVIAVSGMGAMLDINVQVQDPVSEEFVDLDNAAFKSISGAGMSYLTLYPGIEQRLVGMGNNIDVSNVLSGVWRVAANFSGTNPSFDFSVGCAYIA